MSRAVLFLLLAAVSLVRGSGEPVARNGNVEVRLVSSVKSVAPGSNSENSLINDTAAARD